MDIPETEQNMQDAQIGFELSKQRPIEAHRLPTSAPVAPQPSGRHFYVWLALIAAAIVFMGFSRTFFLNWLFAKRDLPALYVLHGIVFSSWIALFIIQTWLVASSRTIIHRRLGVFGGFLAALMVIVGLRIAIHAAHYGFLSPGMPPPLIFLSFPSSIFLRSSSSSAPPFIIDGSPTFTSGSCLSPLFLSCPLRSRVSLLLSSRRLCRFLHSLLPTRFFSAAFCMTLV